MPIATRLTELLGVTHPIMLAPMDIVADGRLAATVSWAGGFGIIGGGYGDEAWLTREMNAAGDARVGVGFITWSMAKQPRLLDLVLERRPPAVMLSFGEVKPHADKIKRAGTDLSGSDARTGEGCCCKRCGYPCCSRRGGRRPRYSPGYLPPRSSCRRCGAWHPSRCSRRHRRWPRARGSPYARSRRCAGWHPFLRDAGGGRFV